MHHNAFITFTLASFLDQKRSKMSVAVVYSDVIFVKINEVGSSNDPDKSPGKHNGHGKQCMVLDYLDKVYIFLITGP